MKQNVKSDDKINYWADCLYCPFVVTDCSIDEAIAQMENHVKCQHPEMFEAS